MAKTIGVIGGVGWPSTAEYYKRLNQEMNARLGGNRSAELALYSFDYAVIAQLQHEERWDEITARLIKVSCNLQSSGAELLLIACNTLHKVAKQVQAKIEIPLLSIAEAAAEDAHRSGFARVGLLGSRFVMDQDFYKEPFQARGIEVIVPDPSERDEVNRIIFEELSGGQFLDGSRNAVLKISDGLRASGAQAVVLGCTELPLLVRPEDTSISLLDTTAIHVRSAVSLAVN